MCSARLLLLTLLALGAAHAAVLGIDVGANSYKAAVIRGGGIDVLLNDVSKRKTPTALAFHPEEGVFYGDAALTYALRAPDRAVTAVGLHLGRMGPHPPPLRASARGSAELPLATEGDNVSAEALASLLLSKVRAAGGNVRDVALSVPAWFGHSQRRALIDAAELAGFNVLALVNDGTALALAYATLRGEPSKADADADHVLIVDVGAYSSRATLATVRSVAVEGAKGKNRSVPLVSVLQHAWEENAAGDAIDALLAAHLRKQVPFPELSARAQAKLLREAKRVKEVLSANAHTMAQVEGLVDDWNLKVTVTRKELDALLEPLLPRLVAPVQRALAAANLSVAALAAVELVGGGGRVPAVQAALSGALGGRALDKHMNGDEALVEGAALFAASLSSGLRVREVRLRDGSPHALNAHLSLHPEADGEVAARDGGYTVALFKRGAKLGGRRTLKVAASEAFSVAIAYAEPEALARGVPAQVANFTVGGFDALKGAAGPVRVVLQFRLSLSGLVELERAHAELTEAVPAAAPATDAPAAPDAKEGDNKEGDKEGDADDAKAPADDAKKDAAPAPAPAPEAAAGGEKKRVRHVVLTTAAAAHGVQMSAADRKEAEAVLARLKARDDARKKREAAKNALEAEVYALRERLEEGATQACSTEAERAALAAALAENAAWLEEAAGSTTSGEFAAREKALKALYAPVARRVAEEDARPRAVVAARAALGPLPKLLANVSAALNVTEEEVQEVLAEAAEALRWLDEAAAAQEKRARHEDGAFTSDEVAERARRIEKKARRLLTRPVRPPPTPAPAPAAATPDAAPAPEAAAEEAREQEALKEEKERVPEN